jgi:Polyketide cyclase / dehydrase and lipid transport
MVELRVSVDIDATPEQVFAGLTDWSHQGEWMPGTTVRAVKGVGDAVGDEIVARTAMPKAKRLGFDDPMRITGWDRPLRCEVLHLGRVVRGAGVFEVEPLETGGSRYTWIEWVEPPLGRVGRVGLRAARRPAEYALKIAVRRFARWVERSAAAQAAAIRLP